MRRESPAMQAPSPSTVVIDMPPGPGPHPALVLAPGVSYHLRMPLMARVAAMLCEHGIAVYRFNWRYLDSEPKGQPSDDLSVELSELQVVIALARNDARVRSDRVVVAGKSMGSVVASRAFEADASLAGAVLLTPLVSQVEPGRTDSTPTAELHYGALQADRRPTLLVSGDRDPYCDTRELYRFAAASTPAMRVAVVGGDHGFAMPGLEDGAAGLARDRSHELVARLVLDFLSTSLF